MPATTTTTTISTIHGTVTSTATTTPDELASSKLASSMVRKGHDLPAVLSVLSGIVTDLQDRIPEIRTLITDWTEPTADESARGAALVADQWANLLADHPGLLESRHN